ncbi:MAG TPA: BON domain-containing protein [Burkholderiales bacterium]|jgi:osmotically-inducible protein OsmY|nr:BON domain-containing protein [Burkholderiales bacterium]
MDTVARIVPLLVFALLQDVSICAAVEPPARKPNPHFARLDTNRDGYLSYAEARADKQAGHYFALFDENRDGRLSEDEFLRLKAAEGRHSGGVHVNDGAITSKVKLVVLKTKDLDAGKVHVETVAGVVRLRGEVDNAKQAKHIAEAAAHVKGVKKVENSLTLKSGQK